VGVKERAKGKVVCMKVGVVLPKDVVGGLITVELRKFNLPLWHVPYGRIM